MEYLQSLLDSYNIPFITAFVLGLMTAISPCPLTTNITAIGYISKDINNRRKVWINGVVYIIGRAFSYTLIGILFFLGADQLELSGFFQIWGEKVLGPLLIVVALFMLEIFSLDFIGSISFGQKLQERYKGRAIDLFLMGILFALAFCPYSGVLYFGMLIPMTISNASGLYLPIIFALGTGIPVLIISLIIAYSIGSIGNFYKNIKTFEYWFRKIIAIVFLLTGAYYTWLLFQ